MATGEQKISLVMGRDAHHGSCAVIGQHVIRNPHRQRLTIDRVGDLRSDGDSAFWLIVCSALLAAE